MSSSPAMPSNSHTAQPLPRGGSEAEVPRQGRLIVLAGPSGVGKGTLLNALRHDYPALALSVSATTRHPRPGEVDGKHYYFLSREAFQALVDAGEFLEWAEFAGNYYGTPRQPVLEQLRQGKTVILEIELEGARQVRQTFPEACQIFILPPSLEVLRQRLQSRSQDSPEAIQRRLDRSQEELAAADEFDVQIINDDLTIALNHLRLIINN